VFDATRKLQVDNQQFPLLNKTEIDTGIEIASGQTAVLTGLPQVRTEGSAKPSEVDLMVFVRPEIIGTVSSQPARLTNWTLPFESSNSEFSGPCGAQPVCCDEGSVFSTALKNSAGRCGCECPCDFSKCKNAFPEPASYDPFEPKAIEIPTIKFDLPEVLPASKNCEGEFHTEYAPREFIPQAAKPMRFTRPVVTPVIYEEPVGR
jgi:hypothetical protein